MTLAQPVPHVQYQRFADQDALYWRVAWESFPSADRVPSAAAFLLPQSWH